MTLAERSLEVRIPKGVHEGQIIRLAGQGRPGAGGGTAGRSVPRGAFQSALAAIASKGATSTRPCAWRRGKRRSARRYGTALPDGAVDVRVPEGSQTGRKLRSKGRGIPAGDAG